VGSQSGGGGDMVSLACVSRPSEAVEPRAASDPTHLTRVERDATVWVAVTLRVVRGRQRA